MIMLYQDSLGQVATLSEWDGKEQDRPRKAVGWAALDLRCLLTPCIYSGRAHTREASLPRVLSLPLVVSVPGGDGHPGTCLLSSVCIHPRVWGDMKSSCDAL